MQVGTYLMIPSTYDKNQIGKFLITVYASSSANFEFIKYQ